MPGKVMNKANPTSQPLFKIHPPPIAEAAVLARHRLYEQIDAGSQNSKGCIISGGAGQGKATLALHYLLSHALPFVWYRVGAEDANPLTLLDGICQAAARLNSAVNCEMDAAAGNHGGDAADLNHRLHRLIHLLDAATDAPLWLVLDGLHILKGEVQALNLISKLVTYATPKLKVLITSRLPLFSISGTQIARQQLFSLYHDDLSFTRQETEALYRDVYHLVLGPGQLQQLYKLTQGWPYALAIYRQAYFTNDVIELPRARTEELWGFFYDEISSRYGVEEQAAFCKLGLLKQVDVDSAAELTNATEVRQLVLMLGKDNNPFVLAAGDRKDVWRLHPLFKEYLFEQARQSLRADELQEIHARLARFYEAQGHPLWSADYFLLIKDYAGIAGLFRRYGLELLCRNRHEAIDRILAQAPATNVAHSPWLLLMQGNLSLRNASSAARDELNRCLMAFRKTGDKTGELAALLGLIYFHGSFSGNYRESERLLPTVQYLFETLHAEADIYLRLQANTLIGITIHLVSGDYLIAKPYLDAALTLAQDHQLYNQLAFVRYSRTLCVISSGRFAQARKELKQMAALLRDERVSRHFKTMIIEAAANLLAKRGDFNGYRSLINNMDRRLGGGLTQGKLISGFIKRLEAEAALEQGCYKTSLDILDYQLRHAYPPPNGYNRSLYLQIKAVVHACEAEPEFVMQAAQESLRLRQLAGDVHQTTYNHVALGVAHNLIGAWDDAVFHLQEGLRLAQALDKYFSIAAVYIHRANMWIKRGQNQKAQVDIVQFVRTLKDQENKYFSFRLKEPVLNVCRYALSHAIEPQFFHELARDLFGIWLTPQGNEYPLLKIFTLGSIRIELAEGQVVSSDDLTPLQRTLLCLLIIQPNRSMEQSEIQLALWPDSNPEKARSKFDTLLSRLRRVLAAVCAPVPVTHYLSLNKGVLKLNHAVADVDRFLNAGEQGLAAKREGVDWEAEIMLGKAVALYEGDFAPGVNELYSVNDRRDYLGERRVDFSCALAEVMMEFGDAELAYKVLRDAYRHHPSAVPLVEKLHDYYLSIGNHPRARRLIRQQRLLDEER